jgi:transcriptional regulator
VRHGRTIARELIVPRAAGDRPRHVIFFSKDICGLVSGAPQTFQGFAMHVPPPFRTSRSDCLALAEQRGFGLVCAHDGRLPVVSWLPFHLSYAGDGTPCVTFHVAKPNVLASPAMHDQNWLLAVSDADAYVSPRWYASPQQVPTWLYKAVNLSGPVRVLGNAELQQHLETLAARFETAVQPPWTLDEISAGRRAALTGAIVGLSMTVEHVEGSFKLNQHKSDADHLGVAAALARQDDPGSRQIAADMRAMRPHVFAAQPSRDQSTPIGA